MPPETENSLSKSGAELHYRALERLYASAPINLKFNSRLHIIDEGVSRLHFTVSEDVFHAAGAAHGTIYFKMLDDAAFFAVSSLETEVFVLTTSFTTYLTRPVSSGHMRAIGKVVNKNKSQFIAEAIVYDADGKEIGRGNGIFVRSKVPLFEARGYSDNN